MEKPIFTPVQVRNPFQIQSLPLLAKIYRIGYKKYATVKQKGFIGYPFRSVYKLLYLAGFKGRGVIVYHGRGQEQLLTFDARNSQFHSVYLPHYLQGYEAETTALLDLIIGRRDIFYDIGSNWGHFALHVASRSDFHGHIHAFEPMPSSFRDLIVIVEQANVQSIITCHNLALSDTPGTAFMVLPDKVHSGEAMLSPQAKGVQVTTTTLDALDLPPAQVIKIDAEGHEAKILSGATQLLTRDRPMIIFESWRNFRTPQTTLAPLSVLEDMGYAFFQPAFLMRTDQSQGVWYAVGYEHYEQLPQVVNLALFPFTKEHRFLFDDQINIFACHTDKVEQIKCVFPQALE